MDVDGLAGAFYRVVASEVTQLSEGQMNKQSKLWFSSPNWQMGDEDMAGHGQ